MKPAFKRKGAKLEMSIRSQGESNLLTMGGTGLPWISTPPAQGAAELSLTFIHLVGTGMWDCSSCPLEKHTMFVVTNRAAKQEHGDSLGQPKPGCGTLVLQR